METSLELHNLAAEPYEEWQRMLRFANLDQNDREAMYRTEEVLLKRGTEFVVGTYDYLRSVPETAAILGWEQRVDEEHLEERRRFFTVWLARTLAVDTSEEFANYLFRAGQYHAGHGPRQIHTPGAFVTVSIGLVLSAFSHFLVEAQLPAEVIGQAMSGWSKYLTVQLHQMLHGYQIAQEFDQGDFEVHFALFGRLRPLIGNKELMIPVGRGACVADLLKKFFNYYPQVRSEALDRRWDSREKGDSLWIEINPIFVPRRGWRVLLNGRDLNYEGGFYVPIHEKDKIDIFPPGR